MILALTLALSCSAAPTLAELKVDPHRFDQQAVEFLSEGATWLPSRRLAPAALEFPGEARAALTREALLAARDYLMSAPGRAAWKKRLAGYPAASVAESAASAASSLVYFQTLLKERRVKQPHDEKGLANAKRGEAAFRSQRAQLLKQELTREKVAAQPDDAAFHQQLRERLAFFLEQTSRIDFQAKLVEEAGKQYFADPKLEAKPNWWKFCFRAGPEATAAAREVAADWLAELDLPPSRLGEDK